MPVQPFLIFFTFYTIIRVHLLPLLFSDDGPSESDILKDSIMVRRVSFYDPPEGITPPCEEFASWDAKRKSNTEARVEREFMVARGRARGVR